MKFLDYIFYRLVKILERIDNFKSPFSAILFLTVFTYLMLLNITGLYGILLNTEDIIDRIAISKYWTIPFMIVIVLLFSIRYKRKNLFEELDKKWKNESKSKKSFSDFLIMFFFIFSFLSMMAIGAIKHGQL